MCFVHANDFVFEFGRNRRELATNTLLPCFLAGDLLKERGQSYIGRSRIEAATNNKCTVYVSILDPSVGEWLVQLHSKCSSSCVTCLEGKKVSQQRRIVNSVIATSIYLWNWDDCTENQISSHTWKIKGKRELFNLSLHRQRDHFYHLPTSMLRISSSPKTCLILFASLKPMFCRVWWTDIPSIVLSGLEK